MKIPDKKLNKVLETINKFNMLKKNDRVVVALSGGPDSVFLLHALLQLKDKLQIEVCAIHIHHGLRGIDADRDLDFCQKICSDMKIPIKIYRFDVKEYAVKKKLSIEEAGHEIRYSVFKKALEHFKAQHLAVGHTADDQAETVLLRLISGAGKQGLAGIFPIYKNFLIRPLIEIKKRDILDYLNENKIEYMLDHTNFETVMFRNKVRHILLPLLKEKFNPEIEDTLCRTSAIFREELEYLKGVIDSHLEKSASMGEREARLDLKDITTLHPYILKHLLREFILRFTGNLKNISYHHTISLFELVKKPSGASILLPGGLRAEREYQYLLINYSEPQEKPDLPEARLVFPGMNMPMGWDIRINGEITEEIPEYIIDNPFLIFIDYDRFAGEDFILRTRKPGDRFNPLGMEGTRKLKDFLIDLKIPRRARDRIPLIINGGEILWVVGHRQSHASRILPTTKRVLNLGIEKLMGESDVGRF